MDFPLTDLDIASQALLNLCADSAPGSKQERVNRVLVTSHPFFKLSPAKAAGKKTPKDYSGTFCGAVSQYFSPSVFEKFQISLDKGMAGLCKSSDKHIEAKLKMLAYLAGLSNLNWQSIQSRLGEKGMSYFLESREKFFSCMFPRQLTLALTYHCNRNCNYCFSSEMAKSEPGYLSAELLETIIEWIDDKKIKQISLFGGEPTLHPQFIEIMKTFNKKGYDVYFPTNGLYPDAVARGLNDCEVLKVTFNIPTERNVKKQEVEKLRNNLSRFSSNIQMIFRVTLSETDRNLDLVTELTTEFHPQALCAALAFPSMSLTNSFVQKQRAEDFVSDLISFANIASDQGIRCHLVKPFPLCRVRGENLLEFFQKYEFHNICDIRQNHFTQLTTVSPSGQIYPCIALPQYRTMNITDRPSYERIQNHNKTVIDQLEAKGLFSGCSSCNLHNAGLCQGLCYAHYIENSI